MSKYKNNEASVGKRKIIRSEGPVGKVSERHRKSIFMSSKRKPRRILIIFRLLRRPALYVKKHLSNLSRLFSRFLKSMFTFYLSLLKKVIYRSKKDRQVLAPSKKKIRLVIFLVIILIFSLFAVWLFWGLPSPTKLLTSQVPVSTKIFDRNGELIYEIYADKRSTPVDIDKLPKYVIDATIAVEDKDFYKHHGVSLSGITRAAYNTLFKQKLQGGSTLTQQLVKNSLLTPERTVKRKLRELVITLIVESIYSKKQILDLYFNQIPYGSTAYGIGAASELYFDKEAEKLTLGEAAILAGITAAPTKYSPFGVHPEYAKGRQEIVLSRMLEEKLITQEEYDRAINEEIKFSEPEKFKAPHFSLWVKEILAEKYGDAPIEQGGFRVTTTLDLELQEVAESAVATEVAKLIKQKVGNGAALVTQPKTGGILAMVGSKDYFAKDEDGKVNIIFSNRQPGSSIKPLNYALALKDKKISLSTPLADVPTCFLVFGQRGYCPVNYDGSFHGAVQTRFALGNSYNIPAVRVLALNGLENFISFANNMGITTFIDPKNYGLSLTLGGGEVRPFDMATAFGVFANEGVRVSLNPIIKVTDWKGKVYEDNTTSEEGVRVLDPEVAFLISHVLHDNNARSAAFGAGSFLVVKNHPEVSVKTGTTNDRRDNWTIGYTSQVLSVVWVGNNDNTEMSGAVSGVSGASPIWNRVIKYALDMSEKGLYDIKDGKPSEQMIKAGHSWPRQPEGIVGRNVCATTGNLPANPDSPDCGTRFEYFLKDAVGANIEAGQKDLQIDKTTGAMAYPELPPDLVETQNHPFLVDPLGTLICLNCPIASQSARISFPLAISRPVTP